MIYSKDNKVIPYASGTDEDRVQTGNGLPKAVLSWNTRCVTATGTSISSSAAGWDRTFTT